MNTDCYYILVDSIIMKKHFLFLSDLILIFLHVCVREREREREIERERERER